MRAAVITAHGGPEVLQIREVDRPQAGPGEVVVQVKAWALNQLDILARNGPQGGAGKWPTPPHISGSDMAGLVAEVGAGVSSVAVGDPVVIYPGLFCGHCEWCQAGEQSMCDDYRIVGQHSQGGMAEFCKVPAVNIVQLPPGLTFTDAAALPGSYITAWRMLMTVAKVRAGETALVLGASGGIGTACIAIARAAGARVIACASGSEKLQRLRELGAHETIDFQTEPIVERVRALTGGRGVDLVADPLGAPTWRSSINSLRKGGRMVVCGAVGGDAPQISIRELYLQHRQILGSPIGSLTDFRQLLRAVKTGMVRPVVDSVVPLDSIAEAHGQLEDRRVTGKIIIVP